MISYCAVTWKKLIRKRRDAADDAVYFVHNDEIFDIVKRAHVSTGDGGRDKMMKVLSQKYANITREVVEVFKSLCAECLRKRKRISYQRSSSQTHIDQ